MAEKTTRMPRRKTLCAHSSRLPESVSIVGLGCSSFSTFFWTSDEQKKEDETRWTPENLSRSHPRVQEWIRTIEYAVNQAGISLLDTAPWYGHGTSEVVIGWAIQGGLDREKLQINTKVGRYEADLSRQFNFSREKTLASVQRSIDRLQCNYIDVLQLHDPEFAPSLEELFTDTIPAMMICRGKGWCKALGMTGYPLDVQHLILQRSMETFQENIWDQALTYSHFNLHDNSLVTRRIGNSSSFLDYCREELKMQVLAAAPLSMGLLTERGPPEWHPASPELKQACERASQICREENVDISSLALLFAFSRPDIPCTILGMKSVQEVKAVQAIANRIGDASGSKKLSQEDLLNVVLTEKERKVLNLLQDPTEGPFFDLSQSGLYEWDGIAAAWDFWRQEGNKKVDKWQKATKAA